MIIEASSVKRGASSIALVLLGLGSAMVAVPASAQGAASCTPVAARMLARGQVLTGDDIAADKRDAGSTLCARRAALVGYVTKRTIAAGEVLRAPAVAPPSVIVPGQPVAVVYREPGIEVRLAGVAANAAASGERVVVRIDAGPRGSARRLEGIAVGPGLVQIQ